MKFVLVSLIAVWNFTLPTLAQTKIDFFELSGAYGIGTDVIVYSGQFAAELKSNSSRPISFNFEYNFTKGDGGLGIMNPGSVSTYPIIVWDRSWFINGLWHPIRTEQQPFSLLFIGVGIGYADQKIGAYLATRGPAIQGTLGVQYVAFKKLTIGMKTQFYYLYNLHMEDPSRVKFTGIPLRIIIGYRFFKN